MTQCPISKILSIGDTMKLTEFQNLYPQGNLISELVQIYHGKYIVRARVEIEGVIRATGMASAETVEEAEDKARDRALEVIVKASVPQSVATPPTLNTFPEAEVVPSSSVSTTSKSDTESIYNYDLSQRFATSIKPEPEEVFSIDEMENNSLPEISSSNVTPFTPRGYNLQDDLETQIAKKKKKGEPVDLSNVMTKIEVEMDRLGWTKDQGRDYLIQNYGKRARTLLTEEELLGFLRYLESQPTPPDPVAGF